MTFKSKSSKTEKKYYNKPPPAASSLGPQSIGVGTKINNWAVTSLSLKMFGNSYAKYIHDILLQKYA